MSVGETKLAGLLLSHGATAGRHSTVVEPTFVLLVPISFRVSPATIRAIHGDMPVPSAPVTAPFLGTSTISIAIPATLH
jgi:hypothetical protein